MLVYGDREETVDARAFAEALRDRCALPAADHAERVSRLIDAGKLVQGLADAAFDREGRDRHHGAANKAVSALAREVYSGWRGWPSLPDPPRREIGELWNAAMPEAVGLREPEGYAFYAVYPELYIAASRDLPEAEGPRAVIGLRSIGASLGPVVRCATRGLALASLRPFGDPFRRRVAVDDELEHGLLDCVGDGVLVVDEGPGASGSSFGAVGDWLEDAGVPADRVTYMPSHLGDLGPQASERHRARWRTANKAHAAFEDVILPRLPGWAEPLIGPLTEPLRDLSGGLWREFLPDAPAWPPHERRKYLAITERGRFLLRFAGLGVIGERKLERARGLHAAGFTPEPHGLAHGFLVERWVENAPSAPRRSDLEALGRYLGVRARALTPPQGAASDAELREMMRRNLSLAGLPELAAAAERLSGGERGAPCAIDGRLHAWEWRRGADGRLIKLDALDHCEAHDLIGAQDLAWDLAGAAVEFGLDADAAERLRRIAEAQSGRKLDPARIRFQTLAYLAFQIGWWTLAAEADGPGAPVQVERYGAAATAWRPDA